MPRPWLVLGLAVAFGVLATATVVYDQYDNGELREFAVSNERALFPNIFNLATGSVITASATCGEKQPEIACKLTEHVFNRMPQCAWCDNNHVLMRHPIEYAIDGTEKYWQSPSLSNGLDYERVTIDIDLRQEYQVAYIILKSGSSPRPGTWVIERSIDGVDYHPWQYFAISEPECMKTFGVPATVGVPKFKNDSDVICTPDFSKLDRLERGEVHLSLVNGRPGANKPTAELQEFTRARYIRLRLVQLKTLNADLMIVNRRVDHDRLDESVTRRYFYTIADISIGGQCICNGHAETCPSDPVTGQLRCECRHNTCGESCNKCCPLFNQLPYERGTHENPNICQACQCFNHADSCEYDEEVARQGLSMTPEGIFEGGGRCIDCRDNTEGINCERCKDGFYRPSGITHYRQDACRDCDCDPVGSEHGTCVKGEADAISGQQPGDCICKPGFGGRRCDRCAPGYRNHPICEPCPCNQAGSLNFDSCEETSCQCKANVEGVYCDRCKPGFINLDANNPQGCQQCFCFGLTGECEEKELKAVELRDYKGWNLTDYFGRVNIPAKEENITNMLMFSASDYKGMNLHYWKAPRTFSGNLLNSYGGYLKYHVYYVPSPGSAGNQSHTLSDVIIEGNGIKLEYYSRQTLFPRENISQLIPIREGNNWFNSLTRQYAEKADLMRVLADVSYVLVRAVYKNDQLQSSIYGLSFDSADGEVIVGSDDQPAAKRIVEVCQCPENFAGYSCESCVKGYRRVNNQLYGGRCEKCNCGGHTDECDPHTGRCLSCQHSTTGDRCERCIDGHYGNPSLGGELGACQPCACPSIDNNHSTQCALSQLVLELPAGATGQDAYVCTACEEGYEGTKCEICADGYFGDPLSANGTCQPCQCNGNTDEMAIGNCDRKTGECLKCIGHTTGEHCEVCKENHWGSALAHTCKPCGCHRTGATDLQCNVDTGDCECKENYEGKQCDRCKAGHGDVDNNCPACECSGIGAIGSECDQISGQCTCKTGVFGKKCDMCQLGYYNFTDSGCQFCHCDEYGAIDGGKCDNVTGKCECRPNADGLMCEKCVDGFFNITSGEGCQSCGCSATGSLSEQCDIHSGQCDCKPGVTGLKCDKCEPNHYGFDDEGCKECQRCPAPGQVCDAVTGDCVCPQNTVGEMCENCTANAWNYHPLKGCELCECSDIGAESTECDTATGQCKCKSGYVGTKCDRCTHGYFNFPNCEPCNCNVAGTNPASCNGDQCLCDENGQCPCKKNVKGLKCDACDANSFSLEENNPLGCTNCFCFNRSNFCVQSNLVWQQVYADDRRIVFGEPAELYSRKNNLNILKEYPLNYSSYLTDATPLYWPMPNKFLGDRTTSYNGYLRFKIFNDDKYRRIDNALPDTKYFNLFPQVVIVGAYRKELRYEPDEISQDGKYRVHLHENNWRSAKTPDRRVTRQEMMIVLQNIQAIYVRATYIYPSPQSQASISEVSLDIATFENTTDAESQIAIGVEMCDACPQGYTGLSCQKPAEGYFRKLKPDYLNDPDELVLVGHATPCACNGHSNTCDGETGSCTNCDHNTQGEFCEKCKKGYHGDSREGTADSCQKCACPLAENSFSDTCQSYAYGRGYICDACKPGYTGQYCESCSVGHYGNPNSPGGFCLECGCHPHGSKSPTCEATTGQCECLDGVTGRDCSRCQERHAFIGGVCTSCDQGCTKILMENIDEIKANIADMDLSNLKPVPRKRLERIEKNITVIDEIMDSIQSVKDEAANVLNQDAPERSALLAEKGIIVDQASYLLGRMNKSLDTITKFEDEAMRTSEEAQKQYAFIYHLINQLNQFILTGGSSQSAAAVASMITEAEAYLDGIKRRDEYISKRYSRGLSELEKAEELLAKVNEKKLNETEFNTLRETHDKIRDMVEDVRDTLWIKSHNHTTSTEGLIRVVERRLEKFRDEKADIEDILAKAMADSTQANDRVNAAKSEHFMSIYDDYRLFNDSLIGNVAEQSDKCVKMADKYAQLLNEYKREYAHSSQQHAKELEHEARRLENILADAKHAAENPVRASNAYNDIGAALKNASDAAEVANKAAEKAYEDVDPTSETSMVKAVANSREESEELTEKVKEIDDAVSGNEISDGQADVSRRIKDISDTIEKHILKKQAKLQDDFGHFDDNNDRLKNLRSIDESMVIVEEAHGNVTKFAHTIDEIEKDVNALKDVDGQGIRDVIIDVKKQNEELQKVQSTFDSSRRDTADQEKEIKELNDQLSALKEKIKEAREIASKITIATKSSQEGTCVRSFISPAYPSPTNSFSIRYRPTENVHDSLIMLTRTRGTRTQASEHFAIELKERRVVVHWDIGSGSRQATNTYTLSYIPPSDRFTWYHIDVTRNGNAVTVTVAKKQTRREEGSLTIGEPVEVKVGQVDSTQDVIFNTVPGQTVVTLGSTDSKLSEKVPVSTHRFRGTVGELIVDGETIPLWSFYHSTGQCDGAPAVDKPSGQGHMFRNGYALVRSAVSKIASPSLQIVFRAYSPSGLLYFRGNPEAKDFIALELRNGKLVCKINLGGNSSVELATEKDNYNDGLLHNVFCTARKGELILKGEEKYIKVIPGENTVFNEPKGDNFIAGVPDDFEKTAFADYNIQWNGFFGCIQQVKSSSADLDFEKAERSLNMRRGCALKDDKLDLTDKIFGFSQPGYIVTRGIELTSNGSFAFTAKTKESNATLIFQSVKFGTNKRQNRQASEGRGFIAFYLYQGYLVCHVGVDASLRKDVLTMRTSDQINDGLPHSVFLAREGQHFYLRVDDKAVDVKTLEDETTIGSITGQMFIGGFPEKLRPSSNELATRSPLIGCISDIYVDYKRIAVVPEMYEATLGTCTADDAMIASDEFPLADEEAASFLRTSSKLSLQLTEPTVSAGEYLAYTQELDEPEPTESKPDKVEDLTKPTEEIPTRTIGRECHKGEFNYDGEGAALFGITTSSHSRINFEKKEQPNPGNFHLDFEFKTTKPDGNLWIWAAYKNFTRYYILNMANGFLELEIQGHKKPKNIRIKGRKLNDNQWHKIDIMQASHEMRIKVDDETPLTVKDVPIPRVMKKRMFVGGVISRHRSRFQEKLKVAGFDGCIRTFNVDDRPYDLFESMRDVVPCSPPSNAAYIHDGGFATFDSMAKYSEKSVIDVWVQMRPGRSSGLIASIMSLNEKESPRTHLMLGLRDGKPTLEIKHADKKFAFNHTFNRDLCNDEWHTVHLQVTLKSITLELNAISEKVSVQMPRSAMALMRNLPVHIGGLPAKLADYFGYTSIVGCVRGMSLGNKDLDLQNEARRVLKVAPGACPYVV
ncbi:hypothetical protein QR680_010776 [Steinernema hermaphroditum]|uniref:Laminin subunit alpha-2 n=1 Tax=Steinernema hermaphroditum TaxID=289476 RepID=A0AA39IQ38_9BILA|nr:hypothetical protein QR680_010776 [Steinernema hermaphroditum]